MSLKVQLITDQMFPIMALPDTAFTIGLARGGAGFCFGQGTREAAFDQTPAQAEVTVTFGQGEDAMHVFWHDYPGVDVEGVFATHIFDDLPQEINLTYQQVIALPLQQVDGEKPCATRNEGAAVVGHVFWMESDDLRVSCVRLRCANRTYAG